MSRNARITVKGYVGNDPTLMEAKSGIKWTQFRVGCNDQWKDADGQWVDGPTMWFTVKAWEDKARNIVASIRKGTPVLVTGHLSQDPYIVTRTGDNGEPVTELRQALTIDNAIVAIDLSNVHVPAKNITRSAPESNGKPESRDPRDPYCYDD